MQRLCLWLLLIVLAVDPLGAQTVQGTLVEEGTARPVEGAFILLLDPMGRQRAGALTDAVGRFSIRAPGSGEYSLQVERIGYKSAHTPLFQLGPGQIVEQDVAAPVEAVLLGNIMVPVEESRCEATPEENARLSEVWEEVRKALSVTAWTQRDERYHVRIRQYERELDARTLRVRQESSREQAGLNRGSPFVSRPAEELALHGYANLEDEMVRYYGPDADVLLSDVFLDRYCFRIKNRRDGDGDNTIGLAFRPEVRDDDVDIEGVLWVDEASAELRVLEYRYVGLPWREGHELAGGRIEFERLPSGAWIVRKWRIRAPAVERSSGREYEFSGGGIRSFAGGPPRDRVRAVFETEGVVEEIRTAEGTLLRSTETAALAGVVVDSTTGTSLAGAEVRLSGTEQRALTDSRGRYRMGGLPAGEYTLTVVHARLDTLGLPPLVREVTLHTGATALADLAIPSMTRILAAACEGEPRAPGTTAVVGFVRDAASGVPLAGARITLAWEAGDPVRLVADNGGRYFACTVPVGKTVRGEAGFLNRTMTMTFAAGSPEAVRQDFELVDDRAGSQLLVERRPATAENPVLVGNVADRDTQEPLAGAQVALARAGLGAATDEDGRFRLAVPPGEHTLEIVFLGYETVRRVLSVAPGEDLAVTARLALEPIPAELVEARAVALEGRRKGVTTYRITAEEIGRYPTMGMVEMIALLVPGAQIGLDPVTGCRVPLFRSAGAGIGGQTLGGSRAARVGTAPNIPLVVLEGTAQANVCDLATINGEDIERLEVIPGLFGVSRYGEKATGGVIRIAIKDRLPQPDLEAVRGRPEDDRERDKPVIERVQ